MGDWCLSVSVHCVVDNLKSKICFSVWNLILAKYFRSLIESHAAGCTGLYDESGASCDPSRVTCNSCGQKFGQENYKQHSRYCGEVAV